MHHRRRPAVSEHPAREPPGRSAGRETAIQMGLWRSWWRNRGESREHGKMRIIS